MQSQEVLELAGLGLTHSETACEFTRQANRQLSSGGCGSVFFSHKLRGFPDYSIAQVTEVNVQIQVTVGLVTLQDDFLDLSAGGFMRIEEVPCGSISISL